MADTWFLSFMDLNGFKRINDKYGHEAGDRAIEHFADILLALIHDFGTQNAWLVRFAGDEFILALKERIEHSNVGLGEDELDEFLIDTLHDALRAREFDPKAGSTEEEGQHTFPLSVACGVVRGTNPAPWGRSRDLPHRLVEAADDTMYFSKEVAKKALKRDGEEPANGKDTPSGAVVTMEWRIRETLEEYTAIRKSELGTLVQTEVERNHRTAELLADYARSHEVRELRRFAVSLPVFAAKG